MTTLQERIEAVLNQQTAMETIGASITRVEPGLVELTFPFNPALCQHDHFMHAGIITTAVDSACGGAAYTAAGENARLLTVEFKVNLLAPAVGERFIARGEVVRAGRTLTVCRGEVVAESDGETRLIALMQTTLMTLPGEGGVEMAAAPSQAGAA